LSSEFKNAKGLNKYWGTEHPKHLGRMLDYLRSTGYQGPASWRDPAYLGFVRPIDNDLFVKVILHSFGELEPGGFCFDTEIHICSNVVFDIERDLELWEQALLPPEVVSNAPVSLWVVDLSHLKWNCVPGKNPIWQLNDSNRIEESGADGWIEDWKKYGEPYIDAIRSADYAATELLNIPAYKPNAWVKSDGPATPAAYEYSAILLVETGRVGDAINVLKGLEVSLLELSQRQELRRSEELLLERVRKLMRWAKLK